jgi:hypothetical protein
VKGDRGPSRFDTIPSGNGPRFLPNLPRGASRHRMKYKNFGGGPALFLFAGFLAIDSSWLSILPAGLYVFVHILEGEMITPMLLARRFTLNPVLIIISVIFWFWMWGVPLNSFGHFLEGDAA